MNSECKKVLNGTRVAFRTNMYNQLVYRKCPINSGWYKLSQYKDYDKWAFYMTFNQLFFKF